VRLLVGILVCFFQLGLICAEEGLWIPSELKGCGVFDSLQSRGCKLVPQDIYSQDSFALSRQIVRISSGCTGSFISDSGLVITNRHCLSKLTSILPNSEAICANGFLASDTITELPLPSYSVSRTNAIIRYTDTILSYIDTIKSFSAKKRFADSLCLAIEQKWQDSTRLKAQIKAGLHYNSFYLYLTEEFRDVRLVLLPPSYINFGKTADNWHWPRHSADFALLRVYANADKESSTNSGPLYTPSHLVFADSSATNGSLSIVMGYPTATNTKLTSTGLQLFVDSVLDYKTQALGIVEDIISKHSNLSAKV